MQKEEKSGDMAAVEALRFLSVVVEGASHVVMSDGTPQAKTTLHT